MSAYTYPGVYIEEISSGQHTITGVATSIAAFIGWSNQGPVSEPTMVESWAEYQAIFGGMIPGIYLGYAVYQFFLNGGSQAFIVRLVDTDAATASGTVGTLPFSAKNAGAWGNNISLTINNINSTNNTFNLQVLYTNASGTTSVVESYTNLSIYQASPQYAVTVLNNDSNYIQLTATPTGTPLAISLPSAASGVNIVTGGGSVTGADGTQMTPGMATGDFETQLLDPTNGYTVLDGVTFDLLCVPGENSSSVVPDLQQYCFNNRAFLILDCSLNDFVGTGSTGLSSTGPADSGGTALTGTYASNSAFYFPWVQAPDPMAGFRPTYFPPCGFVAGIYAETDATRGVWKAPAGINANLNGALGLHTLVTDQQNGSLNILGVNCLRQFPVYSNVVWGARTVAGADAAGSEWKYVNIRRFALYLESSLYQGTQWVVFEPNAEPLWGQVRLAIGSFMQQLFLKGAFAGSSPQQAYFVKCDADNNPPATVAQGILNITVGFAPLYPAEFVVIQIQQFINQS